MARDYKKEYERYHSRPEQIKRRAARNRSRRIAERLGLVHPGDGKDVHHANGDPLDVRPDNFRAVSPRTNRSFPRTRTARKKNPTD